MYCNLTNLVWCLPFPKVDGYVIDSSCEIVYHFVREKYSWNMGKPDLVLNRLNVEHLSGNFFRTRNISYWIRRLSFKRSHLRPVAATADFPVLLNRPLSHMADVPLRPLPLVLQIFFHKFSVVLNKSASGIFHRFISDHNLSVQFRPLRKIIFGNSIAVVR